MGDYIYSRCLQVQQHQDSHTNSTSMGECFGVENLDDAASAIDDSCSSFQH